MKPFEIVRVVEAKGNETMLMTLLATTMFFIMLAATFRALSAEMAEARVTVRRPQRHRG